MATRPWMTAADAAAYLGVTRATLYAYVSRGHIRSQAMSGGSRDRGYAREDVDRLRQRAEGRRDPDKAAAHALHWGVPVLESAITLIDGDRFYYRGHDAVALARTRSVAEVASLIWTGRFDAMPSRFEGGPRVSRTADRLPFVAHAQRSLAREGAADPCAFDTRPGRVAECGSRIVPLLVASATGRAPGGATIDAALGRAWNTGGCAVDVIRAALILCADHELNVSSFTARSVASAGSSPYAVVIAGLSALEGPRHGGASARVEAMLASMRSARRLADAIAGRLRRGERLDGFGHPLYPNGDPRAKALFDLLRTSFTKSPELAFVVEFTDAAAAAGYDHPNLDFALASIARVLCLPSGSPLVLFAIGRAIGWIGHAIEQYAADQLIRPRARYVGVRPTA